ncbi:MAG: beta-propeller fold lactonase family protein [Gammaproteobacteria bacterium]|nr:beta-propeller fold lactonase family protein [Gammaproteobacteria bacterium]
MCHYIHHSSRTVVHLRAVSGLSILALFLLALLSLSVSANVQAFELRYVSGSEQAYARPHDIVLSPDGRFLYVADNGHDRIAVLDPDSLKLIGTFGEGEVMEPHDVVFDAHGRLLVADTGGSRIAIYQLQGTQGKLEDEISGGIRRTEGVAVHPNGRVYATGASSDNIVAFKDGKPIIEQGGLSSPHDVSVASDGSI